MKFIDIISEDSNDEKKHDIAYKKAKIFFNVFKKGVKFHKKHKVNYKYEVLAFADFEPHEIFNHITHETRYVPRIHLKYRHEHYVETPIKIWMTPPNGPDYEIEKGSLGGYNWYSFFEDLQQFFEKEGIKFTI